MTNIASPIADSAAATVKTNNANNWPKISSKKTEKIMKLKLIDNNIKRNTRFKRSADTRSHTHMLI